MSADRVALEARIGERLDRGQLGEAATEALKGYGPEILGYLTAVVGDEHAAGDVFGDFCEDLWRGMAGFRRQSSFRTWAYKIAWNAARMFRRDPFRRRARRLATSEAAQLADEVRASSAHRGARAADRLAKLRASLRPDEQTLLILRVDKRLSWNEIAQVLAEGDAPAADAAALRKRYERLKQRIMRLAEDEGL
jgi:RNA polymerase sigma-70 factor (ECF subfamily)